MATSRFVMMKAQAEVLQKIEDLLNEIVKENTTEYGVVGKETEQAKDWRTGELKWDDEEKTVPHFNNRYDYVPKKQEDMTDENRMMVEICQNFSKKLEKLL